MASLRSAEDSGNIHGAETIRVCQSGIGDVQFRIRKVTNFNQGAQILGAEAVAPTAAHDTLGLDEW